MDLRHCWHKPFDCSGWRRLLRFNGKIAIGLRKSMTVSALPSEADAALARETSRILAAHLLDSDPVQLRFQADKTTVAIPASAARLLVDILEQMASGNAVTL